MDVVLWCHEHFITRQSKTPGNRPILEAKALALHQEVSD